MKDLRLYRELYARELKDNILSYWLPRCLDEVNGGYFNCYDNSGRNLVGTDKYTWSQGRFAWMFSKLATTTADLFSSAERSRFLALAKNGADFLMSHCLLGRDDWRCTFLMDETGRAKPVSDGMPLDSSVYADCFVVAGLARYGLSSGDVAAYDFAKTLYRSILRRIDEKQFNTLPYPLSQEYRAHGIPMILDNITKELYDAALVLDAQYCDALKANLERFSSDVLEHFADGSNVIHEVIRSSDNEFIPNLLGMHANPGHTIEDMWFIADSARILGREDMIPRVCAIVRRALEIGWDAQFGGILHYAAVGGGKPVDDGSNPPAVEAEPMFRQVVSGWGDKLWWVHSEALYTTMLCYHLSGDEIFLQWHDRVRGYVFSHFPNPDKKVGEWLQILRRDGTPEDKVVALPVKDPYHITRNLILLVELLEVMQGKV